MTFKYTVLHFDAHYIREESLIHSFVTWNIWISVSSLVYELIEKKRGLSPGLKDINMFYHIIVKIIL